MALPNKSRSTRDNDHGGIRPPSDVTDPTTIVAARDLFWENVVREMLTGLSMMAGAKPELFDGRIAVLTHAGERIPIGEVAPMFACSILKADSWERAAETAVECTVFRIRTPAGELYTLPVKEIRALHAMTPELLKQLEQQAIARMTEDHKKPPFGFAAFTTVHQGEDEEAGDEPAEPAPGEAGEPPG